MNDRSPKVSAVPWTCSPNEISVGVYDHATSQPVESRPLTPMSDHHSESSYHERTSFVFSMPANIARLPAGEIIRWVCLLLACCFWPVVSDLA